MNKQNLPTPKCPYNLVVAIYPKNTEDCNQMPEQVVILEPHPNSYQKTQDDAIFLGVSILDRWVSEQHPELPKGEISCYINKAKFAANTILDEIGETNSYAHPYYKQAQIEAGGEIYFARFYICYAGNQPQGFGIDNFLRGESGVCPISVVPTKEIIEYGIYRDVAEKELRKAKRKAQQDNDGGELALTE